VDVGQLVLLGYTLETVSDEEDETRRIDAAVEMNREWGMRKEWAEGEEWMRDALFPLVYGGELDPPGR
jgi:hypothetical protein